MAQAPLISPQLSTYAGMGLVLAGGLVIGKSLIDNFVGEVKDKRARSAFIGPIWEPAPEKGDPFHAKASEGVKFLIMAVSVYQLLAKTPKLIDEWGDVQKTLNTLNEP